MSIENPNRIKKKVLIRKELSAVNEWSKCVVSSTSCFGKKFTNSGDLRRCRLFMSKPKIRIMRREGNESILPPSYKIMSSANTRKNFTFNFVLVRITNNKKEKISDKTIAMAIFRKNIAIAPIVRILSPIK